MASVTAIPQVLLRVEHVTKHYPQVLADDDISLDIRAGEIHCLLGENGAGKSTLAEILYGAVKPDAGHILFRGKPLVLSSPKDAIRAGIGMVHQHFALIPTMSAVENVVIGTKTGGTWIDLTGATRKLQAMCDAYSIELNLNLRVGELCVGEQQWVEILKALWSGAKLLILDEPTAVLTPQETARLFQILNKMRAEGLSIIFISHKLNEVMEFSDRITVLRKGKVVATVDTHATTKQELARMMVGRDVVFQLHKNEVEPGEAVLVVQDLQAADLRGGCDLLQGVSFEVRSREILGLAGVSGNGQRELVEILIGVRRAKAGHVYLDGEEITHRSPADIARHGLILVPEDRMTQGLVMEFGIDENLILGLHRDSRFRRGPFLSGARMDAFASQMVRDFEIATPSIRQTTRNLSGGNLQKVILAREFSQAPRCLVVAQPTRGLDVGATEYVRQRLLDQRDRGAAVLLISEDLDEILNLSSCIAVIFKGQIMGILDGKDARLEDIGLMMAGVHGGQQ